MFEFLVKRAIVPDGRKITNDCLHPKKRGPSASFGTSHGDPAPRRLEKVSVRSVRRINANLREVRINAVERIDGTLGVVRLLPISPQPGNAP
jgi:hypothetical protein